MLKNYAKTRLHSTSCCTHTATMSSVVFKYDEVIIFDHKLMDSK